MVFKKEFEHMLLFGDEDGDGDTRCKYTDTTIHSLNFTPLNIFPFNADLNKYLTLYVFFIGTFVYTRTQFNKQSFQCCVHTKK